MSDKISTIYFFVPGEPVAKPRMTRRDKWAKRPSVMGYRAWCDIVRAVVKQTIGELPPAEKVMSLSWIAFFAPPRSWSKKRQFAVIDTLHRQKPDRDNLDKAILDCLYPEDSAIARGTIEKWWDWTPRLEVYIEVEPTISRRD